MMRDPAIIDLGKRRAQTAVDIDFNVLEKPIVVPANMQFEIGVGWFRLPLDYDPFLTRAAALHDFLYDQWGPGRTRLADAVMLTYLEDNGWRGLRLWAVLFCLRVFGNRRDRNAERRVSDQMQDTPTPKGKPQ